MNARNFQRHDLHSPHEKTNKFVSSIGMSFLESPERRLEEQTHTCDWLIEFTRKRGWEFVLLGPNSITCEVVLKLCKLFSSVL